jgi:hypothetical protein
VLRFELFRQLWDELRPECVGAFDDQRVGAARKLSPMPRASVRGSFFMIIVWLGFL